MVPEGVVCGKVSLDRHKLSLGISLEADEEEARVELTRAGKRGFVVGETSTENPLPAVELWACQPNMSIGWDRQFPVLPSPEVDRVVLVLLPERGAAHLLASHGALLAIYGRRVPHVKE